MIMMFKLAWRAAHLAMSIEAAIDAATSEQLLDVNWDINMQITDAITHGGLPLAQQAMGALRKRLMSKNPKTVLLSLTVRGGALA
jgi:hypothetical protein